MKRVAGVLVLGLLVLSVLGAASSFVAADVTGTDIHVVVNTDKSLYMRGEEVEITLQISGGGAGPDGMWTYDYSYYVYPVGGNPPLHLLNRVKSPTPYIEVTHTYSLSGFEPGPYIVYGKAMQLWVTYPGFETSDTDEKLIEVYQPTDVQVTVTTDKTVYAPGETVVMTLEIAGGGAGADGMWTYDYSYYVYPPGEQPDPHLLNRVKSPDPYMKVVHTYPLTGFELGVYLAEAHAAQLWLTYPGFETSDTDTKEILVSPTAPLEEDIAALDAADFDNPNNQETLLNKVEAATNMIGLNNYKGAIKKMENDIIPHIDKWVTNGDAKDALIADANAIVAYLGSL